MGSDQKIKLSIVTTCYNEEGNVDELRERVVRALDPFPEIEHEHIFIDNASEDGTVAKLRAQAARDPRVKFIVNNRNFGTERSGFYALRLAFGDIVIPMACDLQDPPELFPQLIQKWREGCLAVYCVKIQSEESWVKFRLRRLYYRLLALLSDVRLVQDFTGFGLFDKKVMEELRKVDDPFPYMRGLVAEFGFRGGEVPFRQPQRKRGKSSYNLYGLYKVAMMGITSYSNIPIRIAAIAGFILSLLSLALAFLYLVIKLLFWSRLPVGIAPMLIGLFFFSSVQLFFIGILGEYVLSIHVRSLRRPLVVERERVNF